MPPNVNEKRPYDATGRRARAERNQEVILAAARRLLLSGGYGPTTVAAIAAAAGVSPETVYKTFGGKPGLVRGIHAQSLLGGGPVPAEARSDALQSAEADGRVLVTGLGALTTEVAPLVAPVLRLIREAAAAGEPDMAALHEEVGAARYERMLHNARTMAVRGLLAEGITTARAADVMWTYTAPELYENLVLNRGWTAEEYGAFVGKALAAALLG